VCIERCVSDAGGLPDTSTTAAIVGPAVLTAATVVVPNPMSFSADSGWVTVTATLANSQSIPVRAAVELDPYNGGPISLISYRTLPTVRGMFNSYGLEEQFDQYITLAPAGTALATRRVVFDAHVVPLALKSGTFAVTTAFADDVAPPVTLTVGP
jgi:hypothetical protein